MFDLSFFPLIFNFRVLQYSAAQLISLFQDYLSFFDLILLMTPYLMLHQYLLLFLKKINGQLCLDMASYMIVILIQIIFLMMNSNNPSDFISPPKKGSQLKALFLKNGLLQAKQPCTNICQILTPVICLIFTYLIKRLASENLPRGNLFDDNVYPYNFGNYTLLDKYSQTLTLNNTLSGIPARKIPLQWYIFNCDSPNCNSTLLGGNDGSKPVAIPDNTSLLGSIINAPPSVFVNNFTLNYYAHPNKWEVKYLPFFLPSAYGDVNQDIFNNITMVQKSSIQLMKKSRSGLDAIPDGAVTFKTLSNNKLKAIIASNDIRDLELHRNNGVTALVQTKQLLNNNGYASGTGQIQSAYGFLNLQHYITEAYMWIMTKTSTHSGWIAMRETDESASFVDSLLNTVAALIFPLALSLLFPVMLYGLVLQKEQKLVQMMKMNGMKITNYWFVYGSFNFILAFITNVIFFLLGSFVLDTPFFKKTSPALITIIALGWIFAQIGLAAFLQTLLDKARSANIVGYIFAIWTMMIGSTLSIGVYQVPLEFPGWLQALPPFAFNRLFYLMLINCSDSGCYQTLSSIPQQMSNCIVSLYIGAMVLFLLGAYLLQVLPQEFGVRQNPLFPITSLWRFITCKKRVTYSRPERDQNLLKYLVDGEEDPLSAKQRAEISVMPDSGDWPLVINNLRKLYHKQGHKGPYVAVKSFNLRVAARQTFGLLGPNGAGKTTLINMLTGMINPDHGNAWIGGYDINSNISNAQLQMGVCPQFDLLWPQLTVEQHLTFYARLKGVPGNELKAKVREAIEEVNLTKFKSFLSSSLSGGMKRRLSIAISLVGDPQIVFLDEPSTGLDPDNRRQIWQVLVRCQQKRALFLTTHMMEEADALCHRIGIITHGTLRTVGNQLRLKKDYGQGYRLSLSLSNKREKTLVSAEALHLNLSENPNLQDERSNEVTLRNSISELVVHEAYGESRQIKQAMRKVSDFVLRRFPGSSLSRVLGGSAIFKIPIQFKISEIFMEMHGAERQLGVINVSITDSSLEDVFIAVVLKYDKVQGQEEADQMVLLGSVQSEEILYEAIGDLPVLIPQKVDPQHQSQGQVRQNQSILSKNRDSVLSEDPIRRSHQGN